MKQIEWKVAIMENEKITLVEHAIDLPQDKVESHLLIIGILEDLKQKHLNKLKTLFEKTERQ
jgi:hypothetical protein